MKTQTTYVQLHMLDTMDKTDILKYKNKINNSKQLPLALKHDLLTKIDKRIEELENKNEV